MVSYCGFIDVEKSAYFDHLKSVFKKYKFSSFINSQFKEKTLAKITLKQKTRKVSTQKLSGELGFSKQATLFFFTKVIFKVCSREGYSSYSIDVILERYFDLPALFTFLILSQKWVNKSRLWEEKEI